MNLEISYENFESAFKPIVNHLTPDDGTYFETYGEDYEYILSMCQRELGQRKVWTELDCDGQIIIGDGYHYVNRMRYLVTELPCPDGIHISVIDAPADRAEQLLNYIHDDIEQFDDSCGEREQADVGEVWDLLNNIKFQIEQLWDTYRRK